MRILLDHDVPHALRHQFPDEHEVITTQYRGWEDYDDDELLLAAEEEFAVFVTLDTSLGHQQNIRSYEIGVVVIDIHPIVPKHLEKHMEKVNSVLSIAAEERGLVVVREDEITVLAE